MWRMKKGNKPVCDGVDDGRRTGCDGGGESQERNGWRVYGLTGFCKERYLKAKKKNWKKGKKKYYVVIQPLNINKKSMFVYCNLQGLIK